jgi:hypothetical protein
LFKKGVFMNNMRYKFNVGLFLLALVMIMTGCDVDRQMINFPPLAIAPTVNSTSPANTDIGVALNQKIGATFSTAMDGSTLTSSTFTLKNGLLVIYGSLTYSGTTAIFSPSVNLIPNTTYTATITTGTKDAEGNSLANNYVWSFTTGKTTLATLPTVISTVPVNSAVGVALNQKISAAFSTAMNASTITASTFTLKQGATSISGGLTYTGTTAVFSPSVNLLQNTLYTATITTGAKDLAGNFLAANYVWSFTTGTTTNTAPPTVISTVPVNSAVGVALNQKISAAFSTEMNASTITAATFTLQQGATSILGDLIYAGTTAVFSPSVNLTQNTLYTATITTGAKDLAGNSLTTNYVWSFTTGTTADPIVVLGTVATYGGFGGSAGLTSQGIFTVIHGDIGTTAVSTAITGLHDGGGNIFTETPLNVGLVTGTIMCAPPLPGTATNFAKAQQALLDAQTAFNYLKGLPGGPDPGAGELGGLVLAPGTYTAGSGTFKITNGDLTLDAKNNPNAIFVFQMAQSLTVGKAALPRSVILVNGAQAKNIFWQVGSAATINGAGGGTMAGTIISYSGVTFSTQGVVALTTLNGRALSLNASVTFVNTVVNIQ